ncbi:MAG: NAD(P)H-hydrate dehydratase [Oligosphaeraceae bacterium]
MAGDVPSIPFPPVESYGREQACRALPVYGAESHKYSHGALVVAGGSRRYSGAPVLAGTSALRAGAGVVVVCVPSSTEIFCQVPMALILHRLPEEPSRGVFSGNSLEAWGREIRRATALVLGPGMDNHPALDSFLAEALASPLPKVVDADALNRLAAAPFLLPAPEVCRRMVLTPHEGEAARLEKAFGLSSRGSRESRAMALARRTGCVVLWKGAGTLVADPAEPRLTMNVSGNPRLATAGSGDVLSGVIGALMAQGLPSGDAARLGAFLHGLAADQNPPMLADEMPAAVARAMVSLNDAS